MVSTKDIIQGVKLECNLEGFHDLLKFGWFTDDGAFSTETNKPNDLRTPTVSSSLSQGADYFTLLHLHFYLLALFVCRFLNLHYEKKGPIFNEKLCFSPNTLSLLCVLSGVLSAAI